VFLCPCTKLELYLAHSCVWCGVTCEFSGKIAVSRKSCEFNVVVDCLVQCSDVSAYCLGIKVALLLEIGAVLARCPSCRHQRLTWVPVEIEPRHKSTTLTTELRLVLMRIINLRCKSTLRAVC